MSPRSPTRIFFPQPPSNASFHRNNTSHNRGSEWVLVPGMQRWQPLRRKSAHPVIKSSRAAGGHGLGCQGALAWVSFPEPNALVGTLTLTLPPGVFYPSRERVSPGTSHWTVGRQGRIYGPGVRTELGSAGLKGGDTWEPGWETPGHLPLQMGLSQRRRELPPIFTTGR